MNQTIVNIPGMAHFPGGGPAGKECGDCYYYGDGRGHSCNMWREMMRSTTPGPEFSASCRACKYFKQDKPHPWMMGDKK